MSENTLFQFAQVAADTAMHHPHGQLHEPLPHGSLATPQTPHHVGSSQVMPVRKNACIVCGVCFTCSKFYGSTCECEEMQPRRGKNVPKGSLDSRAKKLHPEDKDDYEFSTTWLTEFAHSMYKDATGQVVGLRSLPEVSLCKAHSSTLYRAKKKHDRQRHEASLSPMESSATHAAMESAWLHSNPCSTHTYLGLAFYTDSMRESRLAAKARERSSQRQYGVQGMDSPLLESPELCPVPSASFKRKREPQPLYQQRKPRSSASTPLYNAGRTPLLSHHLPPSSSVSDVSSSQRYQEFNDSYSSHLPPLHAREPSLSSSMQHQLQLSTLSPSTAALSPRLSTLDNPSSTPMYPTPPIMVETVSLKSAAVAPSGPQVYHVRNLVITDTFTFRDLLSEVDMTGQLPPGKRIVITDETSGKIFPFHQAIRNVIRNPLSSHIELCLGLADKTSIDWSVYA